MLKFQVDSSIIFLSFRVHRQTHTRTYSRTDRHTRTDMSTLYSLVRFSEKLLMHLKVIFGDTCTFGNLDLLNPKITVAKLTNDGFMFKLGKQHSN